MGFSQWIALFYVGLSVLLFLIVVRLLYRAVRALPELWRSVRDLTGGDGRVTLIALGVAALAFPRVIPWLVWSFLQFTIGLVDFMPRALIEGWNQTIVRCEQVGETAVELPSECIVDIGIGYLASLSLVFRQSWERASINEFPFGDMVLFLALFSVIAFLFLQQRVAGEGSSDNPALPFLVARYQELKPGTRMNVLLTLVMIVSAYLSVASIAAIPSFDTNEVSEKELDQVRAGLVASMKDIVASGNAFQEEFKAPTEDLIQPFKPFDELDTKLKSAQGKVNEEQQTLAARQEGPEGQLADTSPSTDPQAKGRRENVRAQSEKAQDKLDALGARSYRLDRMAWDLSTQRDNRQLIVSRSWQETVHTAARETEQAHIIALAQFDIHNRRRVGKRETEQHSAMLLAWFSETVTALQWHVDKCLREIRDADFSWKSWVLAQLATLSPDERVLVETRTPELELTLSRVHRACSDFPRPQSLPVRPGLGSLLGPFGLVARWLVQTESLALALITGMLGFGLFGAAGSTLIRERLRMEDAGRIVVVPRRPGEPLIRDLGGAVIRGTSAAVVVFLGAFGGLAVVGATNVEPDPYVLLALCFVAAVFSEEVWAVAHRRLLRQLQGEEEGAKTESDDTLATPSETEDEKTEEPEKPTQDKGSSDVTT